MKEMREPTDDWENLLAMAGSADKVLRPGYFADVVIFDPAKVHDHATFDSPHQYSTGVRDVLVNGEVVLRDGDHTGATPGQVVYGPGKLESRL